MTPQPRQTDLPGERKAAILVVLLGEKVSAELFKHLSRREVARIAREIAHLGPISSSLADDVLHEYYMEALRAPQDEGGPAMARRILAQASISEDIADKLLGAHPGAPGDILGPLLEAPPEVLARALEGEHPQTTALVLLHLPPRRAAQLLHSLPKAAQAETVLRMATLRQVPGEVLGEVATSLRERLSLQRDRESHDGPKRTAEILAHMVRAEAKRVLDEMEPNHPGEVAALRGELFTFGSLRQVDDRGMQELLRQVDSGRLALALHGADEEIQARFLSNLSTRAAAMLREEMEYLGTIDREEQEQRRREILELALKAEAEGRLSFTDPKSS